MSCVSHLLLLLFFWVLQVRAVSNLTRANPATIVFRCCCVMHVQLSSVQLSSFLLTRRSFREASRPAIIPPVSTGRVDVRAPLVADLLTATTGTAHPTAHSTARKRIKIFLSLTLESTRHAPAGPQTALKLENRHIHTYTSAVTVPVLCASISLA